MSAELSHAKRRRTVEPTRDIVDEGLPSQPFVPVLSLEEEDALVEQTWVASCTTKTLENSLAETKYLHGKTMVFLHGAFAGAWQFAKTATKLEEKGWRVHCPTLSGLGERFHTASKDIGLSTHIEDVVRFIEFNKLYNIVLVAHCYGGFVATGVVDQISQRIDQVIFLDSYVPKDSENMLSLRWDKPGRTDVIQDGFLMPQWVKPDKPYPKDVPQPLKTYSDRISLQHKNTLLGADKMTYILMKPVEPERLVNLNEFYPFAAEAACHGWKVLCIEGSHVPFWWEPNKTATLLDSLGTGSSYDACRPFLLPLDTIHKLYLQIKDPHDSRRSAAVMVPRAMVERKQSVSQSPLLSVSPYHIMGMSLSQIRERIDEWKIRYLEIHEALRSGSSEKRNLLDFFPSNKPSSSLWKVGDKSLCFFRWALLEMCRYEGSSVTETHVLSWLGHDHELARAFLSRPNHTMIIEEAMFYRHRMAPIYRSSSLPSILVKKMLGGSKFTNRCIKAGLVHLLHNESCHGGLLLMPNPSYHCEVTRAARDAVKYNKESPDMEALLDLYEEETVTKLSRSELKKTGYIYVAWFIPPSWVDIVRRTLRKKRPSQLTRSHSIPSGIERVVSEHNHAQDWSLSVFPKEEGHLNSIRDLQGKRDLPLLRLMQTEGLQWLKDLFHCPPAMVDLHYPAVLYYSSLHIHVRGPKYPFSDISTHRPGLPLNELVGRLEKDPDIMLKAPISYWLKNVDWPSFDILQRASCGLRDPNRKGVIVLADRAVHDAKEKTGQSTLIRVYDPCKTPHWAPSHASPHHDMVVVFLDTGNEFNFEMQSTCAQKEVAFICSQLAEYNVKVYCVVDSAQKRLPAAPRSIGFVSAEDLWYRLNGAAAIPSDAILMLRGRRSKRDFAARGKLPALLPADILKQAIIQKWPGKVVAKCTDTIFAVRRTLPRHEEVDQYLVDSVLNKKARVDVMAIATVTDIVVSRQDIVYLTQFHNRKFFLQYVVREEDSVSSSCAVQCPFMEYVLYNRPMMPIKVHYQYDFIYGGSRRNGERMKRVAYWMGPILRGGVEIRPALHVEFKCCLLGSIGTGWHDHPVSQTLPWSPPTSILQGHVDSSAWLDKLSMAKVQLVMGDSCLEGQQAFTARVFEGALAGVVSLISINFDPTRANFCKDAYLCDDVYVSNPEDFRKRLDMICSDNGYRLRLLQVQRAYIRQYAKPETFGKRLKQSLRTINSMARVVSGHS